MASPYDSGFYSGQEGGSRTSADAILGPLLEALHPGSVVDVGCGVGTWLAAARAAGVEDVLGVDGPWVNREWLEIPVGNFREADLTMPLSLERRFDLALSMEAAEHLPPARSAGFVADLVALAPVVLFSAAIPGQSGTAHINERWPDFWAELFATHGYRRIDAIRWRHWEDERIEPWYVQNAQLYVAEGTHVEVQAPEGRPLRIVHPGVLATRLDPKLTTPQFAARAARWHLMLGVKRRLPEGLSRRLEGLRR